MNIEVEIRSFITEQQYKDFLNFFNKEARLIKEDNQETHYFDTEEDLRIQKNDFFSKTWLKKGKLHDEHREEIEVKFGKEDFDKLKDLFSALGYNTKIKWLRKRKEFNWNGLTVCLDHTKGYGYIIELEKMCTNEEKEEALALIKNKLKELNIKLTPKEEFTNKFNYYQENWKSLIGE